MKNDYPRRRGGNNILSVMGAGFAIILTIGYLKSNGFELVQRDSPQQTNKLALGSMGTPATDSRTESATLLLEDDRSGDYDGRSYDNAAAYRMQEENSKTSKSVRRISRAEDWVAEFSAVAVSQALSRGVPAALSLAVGIEHLEHGATILSWSDFVEKVVDPLATAKQRASSDVRGKYFKYSANSDLWVEGLGKLGKYSERELQETIKRYALKAFDQEVRKTVTSGSPTDEATANKAAYVAEEIATYTRQEKAGRPQKETVAIGNNAADRMRESEEEAYFDEFVGREVAREIARKKIKSGKYIGEEDMGQLIEETNQETQEVVKNKLTFLGRKINRNHPDAEKMLDITQKENAAAREELYQQKLRENKLDSKNRRNLKD